MRGAVAAGPAVGPSMAASDEQHQHKGKDNSHGARITGSVRRGSVQAEMSANEQFASFFNSVEAEASPATTCNAMGKPPQADSVRRAATAMMGVIALTCGVRLGDWRELGQVRQSRRTGLREWSS